ncbi:MAG: membrane protease subunit HflK [bacterium]|jgi:membrane protease subunit HflK
MSNGQNPWGGGGKRPPELDDFLNKGIKGILNFFKKPDNDDKKGNAKIIGMVIIGLLIFLGGKSFYQVQPGERGVVLRLGVYNKEAQSGLNFLVPLVDKVTIINVQRINKETFGTRTRVSNRFSRLSGDREIESLMLTGDKNVIQFNWEVQYRISDPKKYLFEVKDPISTLRDISESVVRRLVGNRAFDVILSSRKTLSGLSKDEMQGLLDKYKTGITIQTVQFLDVNPPIPVRPAFNEVNKADQDRIRLANEARDIASKKLPKAKGQAQQVILAAEGYSFRRENRAKGDIARFNKILVAYKTAKDVTRWRLFIEMMQDVIPKLKEVHIIDKQTGVLPLVNLGVKSTGLKGGKK